MSQATPRSLTIHDQLVMLGWSEEETSAMTPEEIASALDGGVPSPTLADPDYEWSGRSGADRLGADTQHGQRGEAWASPMSDEAFEELLADGDGRE